MDTWQQEQPERHDGRKISARTLAVMLVLLAAALAAFMFVNSAYFTVGDVVVDGNKYITREDIYGIAGIPTEINIFRLNTGTIRTRLLRDLRIDEAEVTRQFPATIVIAISERQPLAWVACSYGFVQLDKQGVVMTAVKNIKKVDVPVITGVRLGTIYVGDIVDNQVAKNILTYLADLDETTLGQLSEVNIRANGDLVVYTVKAVTIRLGQPDRLLDKAKLTREILENIGDKKSIIEYIDLNYASPYIKFKQTPRKE